ncbi:MAG TPA: hypothetical protein PLA50_11165, partial [Bacteroidia bacterium]|nr:hypothetical protein [Bacteroidia bacterium]
EPVPEEAGAMAHGYEGLREVERCFAIGDTPALESARAKLDELDRWHSSNAGSSGDDWSELAASLATARGHLERLHYRVAFADEAYRSALGHLAQSQLPSVQIERRTANLQTYLGLAWLLGRTPEDWRKAAAHFEESIRIREADPESTRELLWGLSAAWINQGDALVRIGDIEPLEESIRCQERGASILADFDLEANPSIRTRCALCHLNIGAAHLMLATRYSRGGADEALAAYDRAIGILRPGADAGIEESKRMLAVALANCARARLLLSPEAHATTEREASEALERLGEYDPGDWELLNLDLTARCTLCLAIGAREDSPESAEKITDLAEDGMRRLAAYLSLGGYLEPLDSVAGQLFRNGAAAYARHFPSFLSEYLLDHLDPGRQSSAGLERSSACHEAAVETLWAALSDLKRDGFTGIGTEAYDRKMALEIEWNACRERLAEVRGRHFMM